MQNFNKIVVIFNNRLPTERAHGFQIVKMCEELASAGKSVELVIPKSKNKIKENIFSYYGVKNNFKVKELWALNLFFGDITYRVRYFTFLISLFFYKISDSTVYLTRNPEVVFLISIRKGKIIFENHNWYETEKKIKKNLALVKNAFGFITTSEIIKKEFVNKGVNADKIIIAPNGVDLNKFNISLSKNEARSRFHLPLDKKLIIYSGHLYEKKGVYTIAESVKYLSDDCRIVFIGGLPDDIKKMKRLFGKDANSTTQNGQRKIIFVGQKDRSKIPLYLKSADVLVIGNSAKYLSESTYTSPLKLFEYLAVGNPIVASDVPAIREFVTENEVVFFEPDNPESLAKAIKFAEDNKENLSQNAKQLSQNFSWQKRARKIIEFLTIDNINTMC